MKSTPLKIFMQNQDKIISDSHIFDKNNLYYFVEYSNLEKLTNDGGNYFLACKNVYKEDIAKCIVNLLFGVRKKFNEFHRKNSKDGHLHCSIIVSEKDFELVKNTLELIYLKYNLSYLFEDEVNIVKLKNKYILSISIIIFYHILNQIQFAYKIGILIIEEKYGNRQKFNLICE